MANGVLWGETATYVRLQRGINVLDIATSAYLTNLTVVGTDSFVISELGPMLLEVVIAPVSPQVDVRFNLQLYNVTTDAVVAEYQAEGVNRDNFNNSPFFFAFEVTNVLHQYQLRIDVLNQGIAPAYALNLSKPSFTAILNSGVPGGAGAGTVTSVGLSAPPQFAVTGTPVTIAGTLALAWNAQAANQVLAGPATGAPALPTFRALVAADIPAAFVQGSGVAGRLAFWSAAAVLTSDADLSFDTITNTLNTSAYRANPALNTDQIFSSYVGAEAQPQFTVLGNGRLSWGPGGAAALDATLYRQGAADLYTDSSLTTALFVDWVGALGVAVSALGHGRIYYDQAANKFRVSENNGAYVDLVGGGGGGGTVTSVGLTAPLQFSVTGSPVTVAGTLALAWQNQTANTVLAGPTTGVPAAPTFRALVATDIPATFVQGSGAAGRLAYWDGASSLTGEAALAYDAGTDRLTVGQLTINTVAYTWPGANASGALVNNGSGVLSWTPQGTVTSVGLTAPAQFSVTGSPVTLSGTLALAWQNQTANLVFAGPATGVPAAPAFRALVAADIPSTFVQGSGAAGRLAYWDGASSLTGEAALAYDAGTDRLTVGQLTINSVAYTWPGANASGALVNNGSGVLSWTPQGTVTSVGLTAPLEFSVTGSPVTLSGTLALAWQNQTANTVFAGPATGAAAVPAFRALALADLPDGATAGVPLLAGGGGGDPAYGALNLGGGATVLSGTLPIANGGTNNTTFTDATLIGYTTASGQLLSITAGQGAGQAAALAGLGTAATPTFAKLLLGAVIDDLTSLLQVQGQTRLVGYLQLDEITAPSVSALNTGRIYFDDSANKFRVSENGGAYVDLIGSSVSGSGSSGQLAYWNGANSITGEAALTYDAGTDRLTVGQLTINSVSYTWPAANLSGVLTNNGSGLLSWAAAGGGGGSGVALKRSITQAGHGFSVGNLVRHNGTNYVKAKADTAENAEVLGIVEAVNGDDFTLLTNGYCDTLSGLTAGLAYYLDAVTSGAYTATDPWTGDDSLISKPVFVAVSTTAAYVYNWRGLTGEAPGGGGGGTGTVTSVGLTAPLEFSVTGSPVTLSGTLALAWQNQDANLVLAGPATGVSAVPSFRALVAADIPSTFVQGSGAASRLAYWDGASSLTGEAALAYDAGTDRLTVGQLTINSVAYTWPAANLSGVLTNNGSGLLSWAAAGGGSGNNIQWSVNQATHGLAAGDWLYRKTDSTYAKAIATLSANESDVVGVVSAVTDTDNFVITHSGYVSGLSGLTDGLRYYLSGSTAGAITATDPWLADASKVSKPVLVALSTTTGVVHIERGFTQLS